MIIVFSLLILIIILFAIDRFPPDSIILLSLIILVITGILSPTDAFKGFGSDFIIMLASIFIISASLQHNGVVEFLSNKLTGSLTNNYFFTIVIIMISVGILSAFMNNTTVAAVMVLPILGMSKKLNKSPSLFLMPMAFASLVGGTCTLIGTSTNVAGSNFLIENGLKPIGMFEFLPIGMVLLVFCTLFFAIFGKMILPKTDSESSENNESIRLFYSYIKIGNPNLLIGKSIKSIKEYDVFIMKIEDKNHKSFLDKDYVFQDGDTLYVEAQSAELKKFRAKYYPEETTTTKEQNDEIGEIMVLPSSFAVNSTLNDARFIQKTNLRPIGIFRKGHKFSKKIKDLILKAGDIIIAEGQSSDFNNIANKTNFIILDKHEKTNIPDLKKGFITLGIFILAVVLGATGILPMSISFLSAVLIAMSFRVLPADEVYSKVDWRLIILIGGMTAFGIAIKKTGGDIYLAKLISNSLAGASNIWILFAFMVLTVLLTQPMSNAAAALVILPIALQTAKNLGAEPRSFAVAIILSASISMITPFEPASILVLGPGKYKILDFFKIGGFLTIIGIAIILVMIKILYKI